MMVEPQPTIRRFISLKWKALLVLSLALIAIHAAFSIFQYSGLTEKFARDREALHQRNALSVQGLIRQSSTRLQQLGEMIPALFGMSQPLATADAAAITEAFENHWSTLQLDMNIEAIAFFDRSSRLLAAWGDHRVASMTDGPLLDAVRQVAHTEHPVTMLDCSHSCMQYAMVPVLGEGHSSGTLLLGTSLADVIINFSQVSATDIGIIAPAGAQPANAAERLLPRWQARIVALTHADEITDVVRELSAGHSLEQVQTGRITVRTGPTHYEMRLVPLESERSEAGLILIVNDITMALAEIDGALRGTVIAGVSSLLLSELVLLMILWTPLSRLRRTARALPLLARSAFDAARATISSDLKQTGYSDEIDQLDASAITLADQLEALEAQVRQRTEALSDKMHELTRERDFVRGLLDTAQVIIINQDAKGRIRLLNKHGEEVTKFAQDEVLGREFLDLIELPVAVPDLKRKLAEVAHGARRHLHHESTLRCKDGSSRIVVWLHSHLEGDAATGPAVLSVGLDITSQKEAESRLTWLANHDSLTGLYNRHRFQEEFQLIVKQAQRYGRSGALLFLDLDHFKYINDTSGHQAGDALIKAVAFELSQILRATDVVARLGGDEFAIVLPEMDIKGACEVAEKINNQLNRLVSPALSSIQKVSISTGIALFPEHGGTVAELLANADIAMYQAKANGRGGWHLFSREEQVKEKMELQVYWQQWIERALEEDSFILHYQPIVDLSSGSIAHYELLLRIRDEQGSICLPPPIIQIAEQTGLIHAIDHWVLRNAIARLDALREQGRQVSFAINLSAHAFMDQGLLPLLKDLLRNSHVEAGRLIFEITETAALQDFAAAKALIQSIRKLGCKFALDDFGVGFSSLYYLKELPVDYVKIDGSFIRNLADNENDQILVRAMSELARGFGKKTVAEFVGDDDTVELLRSYKVDFGQGYHLGMPANIEQYLSAD